VALGEFGIERHYNQLLRKPKARENREEDFWQLLPPCYLEMASLLSSKTARGGLQVGRKPKTVKLVVAAKDGRRVLLVRRRRDGLWTLPGGKRDGESESLKSCLRREFHEELPELRFRKYHLWKKVGG
jgi:hypothetical protein